MNTIHIMGDFLQNVKNLTVRGRLWKGATRLYTKAVL